MTTLTITPRVLKELLTKVMPFASTDTLLPVFNAVLLEVKDGHLTALATDRYRVGMARPSIDRDAFELAGADSVKLLLSLADCRLLLKLYPAARHAGVDHSLQFYLNGDGEHLAVAQPDAETPVSVGLRLVPSSFNHDQLGRMIGAAMAAPVSDQPTDYNPELLATFAKIGAGYRASAVRIKPTPRTDPGKGGTTLITGPHFIGLIMPLRDGVPIPGEDQWQTLLPTT